MHSVKISSIASYAPEKIVTNDELSSFLDTSDEWIYPRTGMKQRHISISETTADLAAEAGRRLLKNAALSPDEIGLIIVATVTPDQLTPSMSCVIQNSLGAVNAFAFDINAACSGFIYALSIAEKYVSRGICEHAMVLGSEIMSKHLDWSDRSTAVLFGDGAGGVILSRSDEKVSSYVTETLRSDGSKANSILMGEMPVSNYFNGAEKAETVYLKMDGREIFDFATRRVPENINELLARAGLSMDDIKYIVPHQANIRIVQMIAKKLCLSMEKFYMNIDRFANTTSASIPIALSEMLEKGLLRLGNGDNLILAGFGSGLTWGSILIKI